MSCAGTASSVGSADVVAWRYQVESRARPARFGKRRASIAASAPSASSAEARRGPCARSGSICRRRERSSRLPRWVQQAVTGERTRNRERTTSGAGESTVTDVRTADARRYRTAAPAAQDQGDRNGDRRATKGVAHGRQHERRDHQSRPARASLPTRACAVQPTAHTTAPMTSGGTSRSRGRTAGGRGRCSRAPRRTRRFARAGRTAAVRMRAPTARRGAARQPENRWSRSRSRRINSLPPAYPSPRKRAAARASSSAAPSGRTAPTPSEGAARSKSVTLIQLASSVDHQRSPAASGCVSNSRAA